MVEVTAIVPAYNAERYIEKAIISVLQQTIECKMIVVNDASTDKTKDIVKEYQKKYPHIITFVDNEKNEGVCAARNLAVQMADTEYVAYLDADDWWAEDKIELQLKRIKETQVHACFSGRELMNEDGSASNRVVNVPEHVDYKMLLRGNAIPCSSVLIRRDIALKYPMVHDELHEDYIVWLSILKDGYEFVGINQPLLKSRLGENGKSRNKCKSAMMTYKVYRYMGIPIHKAIYYFIYYVYNGVCKYK